MAKFIKVTPFDDRENPSYINTDYIVHFCASDCNRYGTLILLQDREYVLAESPKEILEKINKAK